MYRFYFFLSLFLNENRGDSVSVESSQQQTGRGGVAHDDMLIYELQGFLLTTETV